MKKIAREIAELVHRTSSSLPLDAESALRKALRREFKGSSARMVLETILKNVSIARAAGTPLCQDTGTLTFFVDASLRRKAPPSAFDEAVAYASSQGWLRRNTIDPITGASIDSNVCLGAPVVHYVESAAPEGHGTVRLIMKGGGSENMSVQFSLPDASLGAARDMEGVRRCALAAVQRAQGFGCAPGLLGVCVGGDRASGFEEAKMQLLRKFCNIYGVVGDSFYVCQMAQIPCGELVLTVIQLLCVKTYQVRAQPVLESVYSFLTGHYLAVFFLIEIT